MREKSEIHEAIYTDSTRCTGCASKDSKFNDETMRMERVCTTELCSREDDLINIAEEYVDTALDMGHGTLVWAIYEAGLDKSFLECVDSWITSAAKAKELLVEMFAHSAADSRVGFADLRERKRNANQG